jgi:hypothetical protein
VGEVDRGSDGTSMTLQDTIPAVIQASLDAPEQDHGNAGRFSGWGMNADRWPAACARAGARKQALEPCARLIRQASCSGGAPAPPQGAWSPAGQAMSI